MNVNPSKLDIALTEEDAAAAHASVASLYAAMPFLVSLTASEIRRLPKLGDKSEAFVRRAHQIARDHPAALPLGLSVENMDRDQAIRDLLLPVHQQLTQLLTMVNATMTLAGSDLMKASLIIYRSLQSHGEQVGLREVRDELARRFAKAPRPKEEDGSSDSPEKPSENLVRVEGLNGAAATEPAPRVQPPHSRENSDVCDWQAVAKSSKTVPQFYAGDHIHRGTKGDPRFPRSTA